MLVYATEGLRWPLVQMLRPVAQRLGFATMDRAVAAAGLAVNRRRTYLDDLFVPYIDFYSWPSLRGLLEQAGFTDISRWRRGRLDHEASLDSYCRDLDGFATLFRAVEAETVGDLRALASHAVGIVQAVIDHAVSIRDLVQRGTLSEDEGRQIVIGQGHHRLVATRG